MANEEKAEEFIALHKRGMDACQKMLNHISNEKCSIGDIALGSLYIQKFYSERYPAEFVAAIHLMKILNEYKDEKEFMEDASDAWEKARPIDDPGLVDELNKQNGWNK